MPAHASPSVRPTDDLASLFKRTNQRLASLERASSTGGGGGGGGGSSGFTFTQDTPPTATAVGQTWFDTSTGLSYIRYDGFWVQFAPGGSGAPVGPVTITTGFVAATGFTAANFVASMWGPMVSFRVDIARTGADLTGHGTTGNTADTPLGTFPAELQGNNASLQGIASANLVGAVGYVTASTGVLTLAGLLPSQIWGPAAAITTFIICGTYMKDDE